MAASGDSCPRCRDGKYAVASSQRSGVYQIRYLRCGKCGCTDKQIVPPGEVRRLKVG